MRQPPSKTRYGAADILNTPWRTAKGQEKGRRFEAWSTKSRRIYDISGSRCGEYEDGCLLGRCAL
jgi:hypothetical protein